MMANQAHSAEQGRLRPVVLRTGGMPASDGAGVRLTRLLGQPRVQMLDPFLMMDSFRSDDPGDYLAGFPNHPHRGFETVTYQLAGRMRHSDNRGGSGLLETGGVQWMTAGRGIVHSEMPEQQDGLMWGFQLWVNLAAEEKGLEPWYRDLQADEIPVERRDGAVVKVIAGTSSQGTGSPLGGKTADPYYFDVALDPGVVFEEPVAAGRNAFMVSVSGAVQLDDQHGDRIELPPLHLAVFGEGDRVRIQAGAEGGRFLLLSGNPLNEPVAWGGPFVMNTREEVYQAYRDYQEGRF